MNTAKSKNIITLSLCLLPFFLQCMEEDRIVPGSQSAPTSPFLVPTETHRKRFAQMWDERLGFELPPSKRIRSFSNSALALGDDSDNDRDECQCCFQKNGMLLRTQCCKYYFCMSCADGMERVHGYCSCGNADLFALSIVASRTRPK